MYGKKRIYIGILTAFAAIMTIIYIALIYIIATHRVSYYYYVLVGVVILLTIFIAILMLGILSVVISLLEKRPVKRLSGFMSFALNAVFPEVLFVGGLFGVDKEKIMRSYAEINNNIVAAKNIKVAPEDILILLPHCLQRSFCARRITTDINNCRRCGKCDISGLIEIAEKFGVKITVATGGTLARKAVKTYKPKVVIAVACERDLTSGIQDVNGMPVFGIVNMRPEGPCYNTRVDLTLVEQAVKNFIDRRYIEQ